MKCILACDNMYGIGKNNRLPSWRYLIPNDISRFYNLTKEATLVMGSDTFFSLPMNKRPFPEKKRISVVVTRDPYDEKFNPFRNIYNMKIVTLDTLVTIAQPDWIFIGGAKLFKYIKPLISEIDLTMVKHDFDCDRFIEFTGYYVFRIIENTENYTIFTLKSSKVS